MQSDRRSGSFVLRLRELVGGLLRFPHAGDVGADPGLQFDDDGTSGHVCLQRCCGERMALVVGVLRLGAPGVDHVENFARLGLVIGVSAALFGFPVDDCLHLADRHLFGELEPAVVL